MTIFAIPVIGIVFYLALGVNRRKRKLFDLKKFISEKQQKEFLLQYQKEFGIHIADLQLEKHHQKLCRLLTNSSKSPLTFGNNIQILQDGNATFEAIFKACNSATQSIYLQYYIFDNGDLADRFAEIFIRKCKEGVKVLMMYDAIGSWDLSKEYIEKLRRGGVEIHPFQPLKLGSMARTNYRNHRKILIVDEVIGFTGGINVDDKYIHGDPNTGHWTDTHIAIEGMAVNSLKLIFYKDWYFVTNQNLFQPESILNIKKKENIPIQIVPSGPDSDYSNILQEYVYIIGSAQEYVYIANSYIVPDETLLLALKTTALSGVDVRLVIPRNSDSRLVKWSVRSYFETLLISGVKIYLYEPGFLHSKIVLSDDQICSVGTANMDIRSFEQNFEVNAVIYDSKTTRELKEIYDQFLDQSTQIDLDQYLARPRKERMWENLARLVNPVM